MRSFLRYDVLVPAGVCLIVLGVALRSANASLKRRLASERQDQQLSGGRTAAPRPLTHWERHAGTYARLAIGLGVAVTLAGFIAR